MTRNHRFEMIGMGMNLTLDTDPFADLEATEEEGDRLAKFFNKPRDARLPPLFDTHAYYAELVVRVHVADGRHLEIGQIVEFNGMPAIQDPVTLQWIRVEPYWLAFFRWEFNGGNRVGKIYWPSGHRERIV